MAENIPTPGVTPPSPLYLSQLEPDEQRFLGLVRKVSATAKACIDGTIDDKVHAYRTLAHGVETAFILMKESRDPRPNARDIALGDFLAEIASGVRALGQAARDAEGHGNEQ